MNNEIKEKIKAYYVANDIDEILDYITNLQEEKKIEKIVQENLVIGSPNGAKVSFSIADSILLDKINEIIEEINGRN